MTPEEKKQIMDYVYQDQWRTYIGHAVLVDIEDLNRFINAMPEESECYCSGDRYSGIEKVWRRCSHCRYQNYVVFRCRRCGEETNIENQIAKRKIEEAEKDYLAMFELLPPAKSAVITFCRWLINVRWLDQGGE